MAALDPPPESPLPDSLQPGPLSNSPWWMVSFLAASIFLAESAVMVLLSLLPDLSILGEAFADSVMLVLFLSPTFYFFLLRPFRLHIAARQEAEEKIRRLAYFDSLTGLPNRVLLQERVRLATALAEREKRSAALLFLDLDGFKEVNDTLGHDGGDLLLQAAARRVQSSIRASDTLARLGGDEFVLFLLIHHPDDAAVVARKIIEALSCPFVIDHQAVFVTASMGIALYPRDGRDFPTLLRSADHAMYCAKRERNSFQFCGGAEPMEPAAHSSWK